MQATRPREVDIDAMSATFLRASPLYRETEALDRLREREYARLDGAGHVYLDYTGGGLYAQSQIDAHADVLKRDVLGNPHSTNPTSAASTVAVERAKAAVLRFFKADANEYLVIFTANATGALKTVAEAYPFEKDGQLLLTFDNHNSVIGMREYARTAGAATSYVPSTLPDMRIDEPHLNAALAGITAGSKSLFAYPAQSNFSGVQHDLAWIAKAQAAGWHVLLDAAAFVPTNALDLSSVHPDFVALSFYKMFGYPTGIGCLLARKDALAVLRKPWFAGGTITVASVQGDKHYLASGAEAFEDGTVNYLGACAVEIGLTHLESIGYPLIHARVELLTAWLLEQLAGMKHANDAPALRIYGPISTASRGGTVSFNFFDPHGQFVDHRRIEARANLDKISLRTGCFCNPGSGEIALGITSTQLSSCFSRSEDVLSLDDFRKCITDQSTGAVRVSIGLASNFSDLACFVLLLQSLLNRDAGEI